jgi:hypothetical protein
VLVADPRWHAWPKFPAPQRSLAPQSVWLVQGTVVELQGVSSSPPQGAGVEVQKHDSAAWS